MPADKKIYRKLMNLATQGFFMFNRKVYKQVNDVVMEIPLAPSE